MPDTSVQIPPEAWPFIDLLFNITLVAALIWGAISLFIYLRRRALNLTPVSAARKNEQAQPDFLKVDEKARAEALQKGEAFEQKLSAQEAAEAAAAAATLKPAMTGQRVAGIAALLMSIFTLGTMISGALFQITRMGQLMQEYSSIERLTAVISNHPFAFAVAVFVIGYYIYTYFTEKKWQEG